MKLERFHKYEAIHVKYNNHKTTYAIMNGYSTAVNSLNPFSSHFTGIVSLLSWSSGKIRFKIEDDLITILVIANDEYITSIHLNKVREDYYRGLHSGVASPIVTHIFNIDGEIINVLYYEGRDEEYSISFMDRTTVYNSSSKTFSNDEATDNMRRVVDMIRD